MVNRIPICTKNWVIFMARPKIDKGNFRFPESEFYVKKLKDNMYEVHVTSGLLDFILAFGKDVVTPRTGYRVQFFDLSELKRRTLIFDRGGIWDISNQRFIGLQELIGLTDYHNKVKANQEVYYNV